MSSDRRQAAGGDTPAVRRRAKDGDRSAIARLFELQIEPLRRWAHRKLPAWARSVSDTADLVQDAILRTLNRFDAIDIQERGALGAYLRQAINNRVLDEFRRVQRRGIGDAIPDDLVSEHPTPFDTAAAEELEGRYKRALASLNESDRHLIVGHVELEYSLEQLACSTGRNPSATRMALRRALVRLAAEMGHQRE
jgi:RNA polymerase sigma-70 factor (ECF subfamily)